MRSSSPWGWCPQLAVGVTACLFLTCATPGAAGRVGPSGKGPYMVMRIGDHEIEIEKAWTQFPKGTGQSEGWVGYALGRRVWLDNKFYEQFPSERLYRFTFEEELDVRGGAAEIWSDLSKKEKLTDRYFTELNAVRAAGFMREYVWHCARDASWSEPVGLRHAEFSQWLAARMPQHQVETWVTVVPRPSGGGRVILGARAHAPRPCAVTIVPPATPIAPANVN